MNHRKHRILVAMALTVVLGILIFDIIFIGDKKDSLSGNEMTGYVTNSRVTVLPAPPIYCDRYLHEGWNFVSLGCMPSLVNLPIALKSLNDTYISVFRYDARDSTDPWKSYNPSLPNWTDQQLSIMDRSSGYWINMNSSANWTFNGTKKNTILVIYPGWNLIGYPINATKSPSDIVDNTSVMIVKGYEDSTGNWLVYTPGDGEDTLYDMSPGNAYWIKSDSQSQLLFEMISTG